MYEERADRDELLGVPEVASYLGVGQVTVYRWCRDGRLPCVKVGRKWRVRRGAITDFLRREERPETLAGHLGAFLTVPDNVIGVAQDLELLHSLDAAFFKVGEARGGFLAKFYGGGPEETEEEARTELERHGLEVGSLKKEGRMIFVDENASSESREEALRRVIESGGDRSVWVAFNWTERSDRDAILREQRELTSFIEGRQAVVKTALLEGTLEGWPPEAQRHFQTWHSGTIWLSRDGLSLSRAVPLPGD